MSTQTNREQTDKEIITNLNKVISRELAAINQYFLHARMIKHLGFMKLADYEYKESIQQMRYSDRLIERVLFLGGVPNLQDIGKLNIGDSVDSILQCDLKLENILVKDIKSAISICESKHDSVSSDMLYYILENSEEHLGFIRTQLNLVDTIGLSQYLQTQV